MLQEMIQKLSDKMSDVKIKEMPDGVSFLWTPFSGGGTEIVIWYSDEAINKALSDLDNHVKMLYTVMTQLYVEGLDDAGN